MNLPALIFAIVAALLFAYATVPHRQVTPPRRIDRYNLVAAGLLCLCVCLVLQVSWQGGWHLALH